MPAEPRNASLQTDQMQCLVSWLNARNYRVDNVKLDAVVASDGFAAYAHITFRSDDAKTMRLTHPSYYARSVQVTADGRIHVPQQLRQVAPAWSDVDAGPHADVSEISKSIDKLMSLLRDVDRCGVTSTRKITREYTLTAGNIPANNIVDVLNYEVEFQHLPRFDHGR